jgi:ABC-type polysaccharide/polyol phosphate transport system ATPase subunit
VAPTKVILDDVAIRFRMAFDLDASFGARIREVGRRLVRRGVQEHFEALRGISLHIREGDVIGVIGPNGSGKSTLLRTIGGIYRPDRGRVETFGKVSTLLSLGTGFDNRLSGLDNIRMNGLLLGIPRRELDAMIPTIEEFAEIGDHIRVPMKYYSSGMISRLSFSIVLAMQPDILLIDEVFSVGDIQFQRRSARALHELLGRASCQVIVTHNLDFVRKHCNRAVYVREGLVEEDGSPATVVPRYVRDCR